MPVELTGDLFGEPRIVPARKIAGSVSGLYVAAGKSFETQRVETLELGFEGIPGDVHAGLTRRSGGREPWYKRGTEMRNERQLSIVAADELAVVAARMGLEQILPEWLGANLIIEGVPRLTMLPAGTRLFFEGSATVKVDGENRPCRQAGKLVAERAGMGDIEAGALLFAKLAKRLRGLVAWVEKPGAITTGAAVSIHLPEQWIYDAGHEKRTPVRPASPGSR